MSRKITIAFNKPYGVLSQFTGEEGDKTLAQFDLPKGVYPAGRLDKDSEGLLILTNDGLLNQKIANPKSFKEKTYWAQVEKIPDQLAIKALTQGPTIKGYKCRPCKAKLIEPVIEERDPPIRFRKTVPTSWLEIIISEGKNRQVRRMTAAIGHPTLRLIRTQIGKLGLNDLKMGEWREIDPKEIF